MSRTVDCWLERVTRRADEDPDASLAPFSAEIWSAVRDAYREILSETLKVCGSRQFAVGEALDQNRRALILFLLRYRSERTLVRPGERRKAIFLGRYVRP